MTLSLVGRCSHTGMLGVIVTSSSPAVAARCSHVRARVGAAASQNVTDPRLGPRLLDLLAEGHGPTDAVGVLIASERNVEFRQLAVVDVQGRTGAFSGARTLGRHATVEGPECVAAGNLLAEPGVPQAMVDAFVADPQAHLGDRLTAALAAGLEAGGEEGPVRSAGMLVADQVAWPVADLRVDWHDEPVAELAALWQLWKPQLQGYVARALDPDAAPSFGVAGDP